jgi:hypothetical protein
VKDKVALHSGFLRALGFPRFLRADPLGAGTSVQPAAVRRHKVLRVGQELLVGKA